MARRSQRTTPQAPTAMGGYLQAIVRTIEASGFDGREMARRAGVSARALQNSELRVPEAAVTRLWRAAVETTCDPAIGLRLRRHATPATFGPLAYAALASANLKALFLRLARYQRVMTNAVEIRFERSGDCYEWSVERLSPDGPPDEGIDAFFGLMVHTVRGLTAPHSIEAQTVSLRRRRPADTAPYERCFRAPIRFGAARDGLIYQWRDVEMRLPDGNAALAEQNDRIVADVLASLGSGSTADRVRRTLLDSLSESPTEHAIARKLGTSKSSLHVALAREGVTYRDVLARTREELARGYLEAGRYTIKEIAFLLGFSDATAFSRAFRRWTGTSPRRYTVARRGRQVGR